MVCVLQQLVLFWSTPTSSPCNATIAEDIEASVVGSNINININIGKARASHLLASLTDEGPEATGASAVYVRAVFDHLASDFEHRLVEVLDYSVPWLLREQLAITAINRIWVVLDLGCGSGLVGRVFADLCRRPCEAVEILIADMTDLWRQIGALERSNEELRVFLKDDNNDDEVDAIQQIIVENEAVLDKKHCNLKELRAK
eukprot:CAMPEP_0116023524 /NCGR_PEP_ID=MMETSP0321-20121206/11656_1 /TAXON_ID=163516 /ORGANISM="Leptocylindrus danicus var. danicus, Strain B650" /LENGTH=201 /DNA_ID=CAMNT_0003494847 /DNA_START=158 /DNA_END=761 /DNA_ORIENTATION=-